MGFFNSAHNFIIDADKNGSSQGQDPRVVVRQALASADAALRNISPLGMGMPMGSSSALIMANNHTSLDVTTTLVEGSQQLSVTNGSASFKGNIGVMSPKEKEELNATLDDMHQKLDERKRKKEQRIANGQGHRGSGRGAGGHIGGGPMRGSSRGLPASSGRAALAPYPAPAGQNGGPPPLALMPPPPSTMGMGMSGQVPSNIPDFSGPPSFAQGYPQGYLPPGPMPWSNFLPPAHILNSIPPPMGGPGSLPPLNPSAIPQNGPYPTDTSSWPGPTPPFSYPPTGQVPSGSGPQPTFNYPSTAPATQPQPEAVSETVSETTRDEGDEAEESKDENPPTTTIATTDSSPTSEIAKPRPLPAIGATSAEELQTSPPQLSPPRKEKRGHSPIPALRNRLSGLFSRSPKPHE
ncbi:hypothetical protein AN958_06581 [Leucoagaricus sp. SymC.cos]|nr:hypothetical protein AN958_06581 [Leucoagaricus sp. SymC.cos]